MWIINISALLIVTIYLAYKMKEPIAEVFPVTVVGLILVLYVLAHIRHLSWIDAISMGILIGAAWGICRRKQEERRNVWKKVKEIVFQPSVWMILISVFFVSFCVQDRIALWWDDVNFWAADVKSIYYLDGFAGKYGNVAPEFGDYPPGVQLFKWWFLHFSPAEFKEGLMFAGYYTLNMLLLAPLFSKMNRGKHRACSIFLYVLGGICLFAFPSVVETFYLEGTCSDLPMAMAYGLFLWSVVEEKNHKLSFSYLRQSFMLALIMICKNAGFQWVIYGLIFWILYHWLIGKEDKKKMGKLFLKISVLPVLTEVSWLLFCLWNRRVAKLTGAGIRMAVSGVIPGVDYRPQLWKSFIKGFILEPIHRQNTPAADASVMAVLIGIIVCLVLFRKRKICTKTEGRLLLWFFLITAVVSYGIIFVAHMTIFVTELQYLEARVMTASIERYGVPVTMGFFYVIWQLWIQRGKDKSQMRYLIAMLLVCIFAQWPGVYHALAGYRASLETDTNERAAMVEESAEIFEEKTGDLWKPAGTRVLYLRDGSKNHRTKDTYISYEVSPLGVVYESITEGLMEDENCRQLLTQSHAGYLYADATQLESSQLFTEMTENFMYETVYKIEAEGGDFRLVPIEIAKENPGNR